ncbi:MAG: hypothetical protein Q4E73_04330 [Lachnospiraceae bacterium]|nr:hypothetical protein [Lachnospiraceae bacterium]
MRKQKSILIFIVTFILIFEFIFSVPIQAKELYAFTKESIPCYSDEYGSSRAGSIPQYHGFKVEQKAGSYYLVTYEKKGKTRSGWIAKEDYRDWGLQYDGSEIPLVVSGTYLMGGQKVVITFLGNGEYRIQLKENEEYFSAQGNNKRASLSFSSRKENEGNIWIFIRTDYNLLIQNKKTGLYLIPNGSVIKMVTFQQAKKYSWILTRQGNHVDPYRDFLQYDGRWGAKKYGSSTQMAKSACGVLAIVNAAFALNGQFIDPMDGAQYACDTGFRVEYNGTDEGYFKAFAKNLGERYGFQYEGKAETIYSIKKALKRGDVVVAHVPGHYLCIADYDEKKGKYLILDSHPLPKRKTSPFGTWVSEKRLGSGSLSVATSFVYTKVKDEEFTWNLRMQELEVIQDIATNMSPDAIKKIFDRLLKREGK